MSVTRPRLAAFLGVVVPLSAALTAAVPTALAAAPAKTADATCSYPTPSPSPTVTPSPSPSPSPTATGIQLGPSTTASPSASASPTLAPTSGCTGYDVSRFQCGTTLPATRAFGVVQVVGAAYGAINKCLTSQWAWATASPEPADLYIFAGDTNASDARWRSTTAGPKACTGKNGDTGCDYDYGYNAAKAAVFDVACDGELSPDNAGGVCLQPQAPVRWWVDVEGCSEGYWKQNACSSSASAADKAAAQQGNIAAIQGYVDGLLAYPQRVSSVGIYGSPLGDWKVITGGDTTTFASVPYWYPDFSGDAQAMRTKWCGKTGPNGGPIVMVQGKPGPAPGYPNDIDPDARCGPVVPGLAITTALDKKPSGQTVSVWGTGAPGATLTLKLKRVTALTSTPLPAVTVDGTGHWGTSFTLPVNAVLSASDGTRTVTRALQAVAKVSASRYLHKGHDVHKARSCLVQVTGNAAPWTVGQKVKVFGSFAKLLATATTTKAKTSGFGSWKAMVSVPCGKRTAVLPVVSGVARAGRYAVDGRGKPFKITGS